MKQVSFLVYLCLLLSASTASSARLKGIKKNIRQRALGKDDKSPKEDKAGYNAVDDFNEEESLFYGKDEKIEREFNSYDDPEAMAASDSGLDEVEDHQTIERNEDLDEENDTARAEEATKELEVQPETKEDSDTATRKQAGEVSEEYESYDDLDALAAETTLRQDTPPDDPTWGGNIVDPTNAGATDMKGQGLALELRKENLVPAETMLSRQQQQAKNTATFLLVAAVGGVIIFAGFIFFRYQLYKEKSKREAAQKSEFSFTGTNADTVTDTASSQGEIPEIKSRIARTVTFESDTCPMTPPCQPKWEDTEDPWVYAESVHNLDSIERARKLNPCSSASVGRGSPVGRRLCKMVDGRRAKFKRSVPGGDYKDIDESSEASFEDVETDAVKEDLSEFCPHPTEEPEVRDRDL